MIPTVKNKDSRKVVIIGGGIAGLCTAVYALRCGYRAEVLEMHSLPGGLATSWRRSGYTFENCLHWLLGSNPKGQMHPQWAEVCDIDKLTFVNHEEFARLETMDGKRLRIFTDIARLEAEMLSLAPQDSAEIRRFTSAVRGLTRFQLPDPIGGLANLGIYLDDLPFLPLLRRLSRCTCGEYGERFTHPLLRSFFTDGYIGKMSAIVLVLSLAWMSQGNAGYAIGGSQAIIRLIQHRLAMLGGNLRLGARVAKILVEDDTAFGVELEDGETIFADWVVSAADGHSTLVDLLGERYTDKSTEYAYRDLETFPSYLQVSLGVARELAGYPGFVTRLLDSPVYADPATPLNQLSFRIFHFDPTFAPPGKTAVTCFLPTANFEYWVNLEQCDPGIYQAEKHRIAQAAIDVLAQIVPGIRQSIELIDVSTPATVIRYTGNWKGSMEGWLLTPATGFRQLRNTLPGLDRFLMAGHWVMPGGGLPSGLLTARSAVHAICRRDRVPFNPARQPALDLAPGPSAHPTSASTAAR